MVLKWPLIFGAGHKKKKKSLNVYHLPIFCAIPVSVILHAGIELRQMGMWSSPGKKFLLCTLIRQ